MKIGIIGGGISGLYCAKLLEEKHDCTIFESNKWGGDIQTTNIDNKCYPVSAMFVMSNGHLLQKELKENGVKNVSFRNWLKDEYTVSLISMILIGVFFRNNIIVVVLMLILIFTLVYVATSRVVNAFGGNNTFKLPSISMLGKFASLTEKCGFMKIVNNLLKNKNINYVNEPVINIDRDNTTLSTKNNKYKFDKIIIACPYKGYKSIIQLTDYEKNILTDITYFKFYSTIIKFKNSDIPNVPDTLGSVKLDSQVYIYASSKPIEFSKNVLIKKQYEWTMFKNNNITNINTENIYFVGKERSANSVDECMKLALKTCLPML
jgi:protoporphyrinogen oxidase